MGLVRFEKHSARQRPSISISKSHISLIILRDGKTRFDLSYLCLSCTLRARCALSGLTIVTAVKDCEVGLAPKISLADIIDNEIENENAIGK